MLPDGTLHPMQSHDSYGKRVLQTACQMAGDSVAIDGHRIMLCDGVTCSLDAMLSSGIAVEIESRVNKQVRGAILDLILHPGEAKLMILIPVHMGDTARTTTMCKAIIARLSPETPFMCATLSGTGGSERLAEDLALVAEAIGILRDRAGLSKVSQLGEQA